MDWLGCPGQSTVSKTRQRRLSIRIPVDGAGELVQSRGTDLTRIEINRAEEPVGILSTETPADYKFSVDSIPPARVVVDGHTSEVDIPGSKAIQCLLPDGFAANVNCFGLREAATIPEV